MRFSTFLFVFSVLAIVSFSAREALCKDQPAPTPDEKGNPGMGKPEDAEGGKPGEGDAPKEGGPGAKGKPGKDGKDAKGGKGGKGGAGPKGGAPGKDKTPAPKK
ncbi:hypothetical protein NECID01_0489 [Nematocida sp. AWRm77]|nr:hypothetical protein NECID01_0489 [Nematocida sp. AWRm77]